MNKNRDIQKLAEVLQKGLEEVEAFEVIEPQVAVTHSHWHSEGSWVRIFDDLDKAFPADAAMMSFEIVKLNSELWLRQDDAELIMRWGVCPTCGMTFFRWVRKP